MSLALFVPSSAPSRATAGVDSGVPGAGLRNAPSAVRWHSALGALPLAGYLLLHLGGQALALSGGGLYHWHDTLLARHPLLALLEIGVVCAPLAGHVVLGVGRLLAPPAPPDALWARPFGRALQRGSALLLLVFLAQHLWQFEGRLWLGEIERSDAANELRANLSSTVWGGVPLSALGYLLALAAAALHAAQGVYRAALGWGWVAMERRRGLARACVAGGLVVFLGGAAVVIQLATGSLSFHLPG
jgi:succinate dehydrogenase / fumarate reductase cytochrome b subunit